MSEHHHWRHICSVQNLFYTFITQYQHSKYALFFSCNVFLIFSNFLFYWIQSICIAIFRILYALCLCNLFHKLFNLALHCLYLFYLFIRILCYPSIALIVISQCIPPNCSILNLYSVPLSWGRMYDKSCIINSPPSPLPLPSSRVASKARGKRGHWTSPPPPSHAGNRIQNRVTVDSLATSGVGGGVGGGGQSCLIATAFISPTKNAREFTNTVNNFYIELYALPYCNNVGQLVSLFAWHKSHQIAAESLQAASGSRYLYPISLTKYRWKRASCCRSV